MSCSVVRHSADTAMISDSRNTQVSYRTDSMSDNRIEEKKSKPLCNVFTISVLREKQQVCKG